jgi:hypothetical protein
MRVRPCRHALPIGLIVSSMLHLLVLWANPALRLTLAPPPSGPDRADGEPARLIAFRIATSPDAAPIRVRSATSSRSANVAAPVASAPAPDAAASDAARARDTDVSAVDRLTYRPGTIWMRSAPRLESEAECRKREVTERLEKGIADRKYAKLPPKSDSTFGVTLRIPFGKKPPPPAQTVPAPPLPDSLRGRTPGGDELWATRRSGTIATLRRPAGCGDTIPFLERLPADTIEKVGRPR